jgi:hypothetical protein
MSGTVPPLPQYASMAWCSVLKKGQGQLYLYVTLKVIDHTVRAHTNKIPDKGIDGILPPRHYVQTSSGSHPASYPMGTGGSYPGNKVAGV